MFQTTNQIYIHLNHFKLTTPITTRPAWWALLECHLHYLAAQCCPWDEHTFPCTVFLWHPFWDTIFYTPSWDKSYFLWFIWDTIPESEIWVCLKKGCEKKKHHISSCPPLFICKKNGVFWMTNPNPNDSIFGNPYTGWFNIGGSTCHLSSSPLVGVP